MKSNTSRALKKKFSHFLKKVYWDGGGIWSKGFFVSTVGIDEEITRRYVQKQGEKMLGKRSLNYKELRP